MGIWGKQHRRAVQSLTEFIVSSIEAARVIETPFYYLQFVSVAF